MKQAEAACLDLVEAWPSNSKALFGKVLRYTGRAETAIAPFERAFELTPNFADAQPGSGNAP